MAKINLIEAFQALAHEKKIDEFYLIEELEKSLARSYKHTLRLENDCSVIIDREEGKIYVYELVPVGEPNEDGEYEDFEEVDVTPDDVSRIAAQNAKIVIKNIVNDAEKQSVYEEFEDRVGEIITGTILQHTKDFTIIKIREGVEAELPHFDTRRFPDERNEVPKGEHYFHNQRIKVLIIEVRDPLSEDKRRGERNRPSIVVSRSNPNLIKALFEMEVPEIYDGLVEIKSVAREPGARSKISVASHDSNVDAVGACVGPRGSRVRMVVEELHSERVDVIQYSDDPVEFIGNSLSPAKVQNVTLDEDTSTASVFVADDQLSLAIGKEGQNARLAARLTGWKLDIQSSSFSGEIDEEDDELDLLNVESDDTCAYVSEDGKRCRNRAREGSKYCGIHSKMEK